MCLTAVGYPLVDRTLSVECFELQCCFLHAVFSPSLGKLRGGRELLLLRQRACFV